MADSGLAKLRQRLAAVPAEIRKAVKPALDTSANEMVTLAKSLAPIDDGTLRDSIVQEPGPHELSRVVKAGGKATTREVRKGSGVRYDYALAQEFGTVNQGAQLFFWPAYRLVRKRVKSRISRAVGKAVKDFNNGK